jgi:hypothetical protein
MNRPWPQCPGPVRTSRAELWLTGLENVSAGRCLFEEARAARVEPRNETRAERPRRRIRGEHSQLTSAIAASRELSGPPGLSSPGPTGLATGAVNISDTWLDI